MPVRLFEIIRVASLYAAPVCARIEARYGWPDRQPATLSAADDVRNWQSCGVAPAEAGDARYRQGAIGVVTRYHQRSSGTRLEKELAQCQNQMEPAAGEPRKNFNGDSLNT